MNEELLIKILCNNEMYRVISTRTRQFYISKTGIALFSTKNKAVAFTSNRANVEVDGPRIFDYAEIRRFCLAYGINECDIWLEDSKVKLDIYPNKREVGYYNAPLNNAFLLLKQNKKKEDIPSIIDVEYIIPTSVELKDGLPDVYFCFARNKNDSLRIPIVFTDIDNYNEWSTQFNKDNSYAPLEIKFNELCRICDNQGFVLNPTGAMLVITKETLEEALIKKEENTEKGKEDAQPPE